jgi:hypothetical protein
MASTQKNPYIHFWPGPNALKASNHARKDKEFCEYTERLAAAASVRTSQLVFEKQCIIREQGFAEERFRR